MPGSPECPVKPAEQALGHWKTQEPVWGHGRALPAGGNTDFHPFADLQHFFGFQILDFVL